MKAIRKSDGKEIDVILYHPKEYIEIDEDTKGRKLYGRAIYPAEALIVQEPIDWASFRREAAKDILPSLIKEASKIYGFESLNKGIWCEQAIEWADELIKKLKEEKK